MQNPRRHKPTRKKGAMSGNSSSSGSGSGSESGSSAPSEESDLAGPDEPEVAANAPNAVAASGSGFGSGSSATGPRKQAQTAEAREKAVVEAKKEEKKRVMQESEVKGLLEAQTKAAVGGVEQAELRVFKRTHDFDKATRDGTLPTETLKALETAMKRANIALEVAKGRSAASGIRGDAAAAMAKKFEEDADVAQVAKTVAQKTLKKVQADSSASQDTVDKATAAESEAAVKSETAERRAEAVAEQISEAKQTVLAVEGPGTKTDAASPGDGVAARTTGGAVLLTARLTGVAKSAFGEEVKLNFRETIAEVLSASINDVTLVSVTALSGGVAASSGSGSGSGSGSAFRRRRRLLAAVRGKSGLRAADEPADDDESGAAGTSGSGSGNPTTLVAPSEGAKPNLVGVEIKIRVGCVSRPMMDRVQKKAEAYQKKPTRLVTLLSELQGMQDITKVTLEGAVEIDINDAPVKKAAAGGDDADPDAAAKATAKMLMVAESQAGVENSAVSTEKEKKKILTIQKTAPSKDPAEVDRMARELRLTYGDLKVAETKQSVAVAKSSIAKAEAMGAASDSSALVAARAALDRAQVEADAAAAENSGDAWALRLAREKRDALAAQKKLADSLAALGIAPIANLNGTNISADGGAAGLAPPGSRPGESTKATLAYAKKYIAAQRLALSVAMTALKLGNESIPRSGLDPETKKAELHIEVRRIKTRITNAMKRVTLLIGDKLAELEARASKAQAARALVLEDALREGVPNKIANAAHSSILADHTIVRLEHVHGLQHTKEDLDCLLRGMKAFGIFRSVSGAKMSELNTRAESLRTEAEKELRLLKEDKTTGDISFEDDPPAPTKPIPLAAEPTDMELLRMVPALVARRMNGTAGMNISDIGRQLAEHESRRNLTKDEIYTLFTTPIPPPGSHRMRRYREIIAIANLLRDRMLRAEKMADIKKQDVAEAAAEQERQEASAALLKDILRRKLSKQNMTEGLKKELNEARAEIKDQNANQTAPIRGAATKRIIKALDRRWAMDLDALEKLKAKQVVIKAAHDLKMRREAMAGAEEKVKAAARAKAERELAKYQAIEERQQTVEMKELAKLAAKENATDWDVATESANMQMDMKAIGDVKAVRKTADSKVITAQLKLQEAKTEVVKCQMGAGKDCKQLESVVKNETKKVEIKESEVKEAKVEEAKELVSLWLCWWWFVVGTSESSDAVVVEGGGVDVYLLCRVC